MALRDQLVAGDRQAEQRHLNKGDEPSISPIPIFAGISRDLSMFFTLRGHTHREIPEIFEEAWRWDRFGSRQELHRRFC